MGPMKIDETHALDVRPHPHIGLSTVTYLFEGRGFHRDSLGSAQVIEPGDLNWMTAGRGIVHSERTPETERDPNRDHWIHGVQIWVGLPAEFEECEPEFKHYSKDILPELELDGGFRGKLLIGAFKGATSPVKTYSKTLFMDLEAGQADGFARFSFEEQELGVFLVQGSATVDSVELKADDLIVVADPGNVQIEASNGARLIVIGGDPFAETRWIWWNFVSSKKESIHRAAALWREQQMGRVPGESDYIPLPNDPLP